jgi:hypothetical protein
MYCLCVNVYCHRVSTQLQLTNISISLLACTLSPCVIYTLSPLIIFIPRSLLSSILSIYLFILFPRITHNAIEGDVSKYDGCLQNYNTSMLNLAPSPWLRDSHTHYPCYPWNTNHAVHHLYYLLITKTMRSQHQTQIAYCIDPYSRKFVKPDDDH